MSCFYKSNQETSDRIFKNLIFLHKDTGRPVWYLTRIFPVLLCRWIRGARQPKWSRHDYRNIIDINSIITGTQSEYCREGRILILRTPSARPLAMRHS